MPIETDARDTALENAVLKQVRESQGDSTAMQVLNAVSLSLHVGVPTVQREFYRLVSDGQIKIGQSFRPIVA